MVDCERNRLPAEAAALTQDAAITGELSTAVTRAPASDARQRDKVLMLGATLARMAVGLLTFIVLARFLGPDRFGVIATAIAYTTFLALISDWGLGVSALREAAATPSRAGSILREALVIKALVALPLSFVGATIAIVALPTAWLPIYALALIGGLAYSFADLTLIAARACRRFDIEAKVVIAGSVMMLVVLGGVAALTHNLLYSAIAFAVTRLLYAGLAALVLYRRLSGPPNPGALATRLRARMRHSTSYAIDAVLTNASGQVDLLLFGALLSAHAIGIYQAGARLVQVIMPLAVVFSTVYLPVLAAAAVNGDFSTFDRNARRLNIEFAALGSAAGAGFALLGPVVAPLILGSKYIPLAPLWAGFGAFSALRVMAAAYGIQLAALGRITPRITSQLAAICTLTALALIAVPHYGLNLTSWLLAASSVPSMLVLAFALWREQRCTATLFATLLFISGVTGLFAITWWTNWL